MQAVKQGRLYVSKVITVAFALFVSLFVMFIFPIAAHAEEVPPTDTTVGVPVEEPVVIIEAPGVPVATSPTDDLNIVWEWTPPAGGLTPDAPVVTPTEPTDPASPTDTSEVPPVEPVVVEYPTDITQYGYELWDQGVVVASGTVESAVNTVTTAVKSTGSYIFKLWSITREAKNSEVVTATVAIVAPVLQIPETPPLETPIPLETESVPELPESIRASYASAVASNYRDVVSNYSSDVPANDTKVLSATDDKKDSSQAETVAVVKTSTQGWLFLGLPWYVWLLIAAVIFTAWRLVLNALATQR